MRFHNPVFHFLRLHWNLRNLMLQNNALVSLGYQQTIYKVVYEDDLYKPATVNTRMKSFDLQLLTNNSINCVKVLIGNNNVTVYI